MSNLENCKIIKDVNKELSFCIFMRSIKTTSNLTSALSQSSSFYTAANPTYEFFTVLSPILHTRFSKVDRILKQILHVLSLK